MAIERIESTAERATLLARGRTATARPDEVRELLFADLGSDLIGTDEELTILLFDARIWTIPLGTPGLNTLLFHSWRSRFVVTPCSEVYSPEPLPCAWRKRFLGIPIPTPGLGCHSRDGLPPWKRRTPIDFASLPLRYDYAS